MKKGYVKKGIYVLLAAVAIALISALSIYSAGHSTDAASDGINTLMRPIKSAVSAIADQLEHVYAYMYKYDSVVAENEQLKSQIAQLQEDSREYEEVNAENDRLRALLDFSTRHSDFQYQSATILSWSASSWSSSFTISRGSTSGIAMDQCVINENGYLIGKITEVSATTATVTTFLDTTSSIGASESETGDVGIVSGDFSLMKNGTAKLQYLADIGSAVTGDTVVTSGKGTIYPRDLVLGTISQIVISESGTENYAIVTPAADFTSLSDVYVITSFDNNN